MMTPLQVCKKWKRLPKNYFTKTVDLVIDNKLFEAPGSNSGRSYQKQTKVRFTHRNRKEGLDPVHTKPDQKRHRKNLGAGVKILAGISANRIVVWEEARGRWNGKQAAAMFNGVIKKALKKCRPRKKKHLVLEDNDPAGYKSKLAVAAKKAVGIKTLSLPPYSPDLNPLDYSIWDNIQRRMLQKHIDGYETRKAYVKRLRLTALRTPAKVIADAMKDMKPRIKAVVEKKGDALPKD